MITDDEVMRLFEQADPARTTDDVNNTPDATGYLAALRQRSNNVTYIHPTANPTEEPDRRRRLAMIAAATAAVVLAIGALVLVASDDEGGQEIPATIPPTVPTPTTTVVPSTTPTTTAAATDDVVAQANAFLAAIETGDAAEVQALLAPDYESRQWMGPIHQAASGAAYDDPSCKISDEESAEGTVVVCTTSITLAAHRLTHTAAAPGSLILSVGDAGVTAMDIAVNNLGLLPFEFWKEANWPAGLPIEIDDITTDTGVVEYARVEEQLAEDWVAAATDAVEGGFADFNAGEVDAFTARFDTAERFASAEAIAALVAEGQQYLVSTCDVDGIEPAGLAVVCDAVVRHGRWERSGPERTITIQMVVGTDGTITRVSDDIDPLPLPSFRSGFEQWLLTTHADVHAQVTWVAFGESRLPSAEDQALVAPFYEEFVVAETQTS